MYLPIQQSSPPSQTPLHTHLRRDTNNSATTGAVVAIVAAAIAFAFLMAKAWSRNRELKMQGMGSAAVESGGNNNNNSNTRTSNAFTSPFLDYVPRMSRHSHMTTNRRREDDDEQLPAYEPPSKPVPTAETAFNMHSMHQTEQPNGGGVDALGMPLPPTYEADRRDSAHVQAHEGGENTVADNVHHDAQATDAPTSPAAPGSPASPPTDTHTPAQPTQPPQAPRYNPPQHPPPAYDGSR
ncbi:hypothetical protein E3P99_03393 [Wallemia hederae]|uniref:Uncharacterized protein n=1 Tax=Wallemia hederae TaxID=1540922 RepID=A0A4T0FGB4_9BASI|nr:hypothetical protein E3P99_03393 [Wallemia hederae]